MMEPSREPVLDAVSPERSPEDQVRVSSLPEVSRNQLWWQLTALVLVSTVSVIIGASFDKQLARFMPESRTLASTYNGKASGLEALSRLTAKLGKDVTTWEKPYRHLSAVKGTLVIISPTESLKEFEIDQILGWVKEGNSFVYFDDYTYKSFRGVPSRL
ncbi:MAG: DUF4350 domain-containing protein, partial [Cyanobacteria bacterium]|nr:DUF4350 domain-containing protein [Cyanobacteriota bacterium]